MNMEEDDEIADEIAQEELAPFAAALRFFTQGEYKKRNVDLAVKSFISGGYLSQIANESRPGTIKVREAIAAACGYSYEGFLELGHKQLEMEARQQPNGYRSNPNHPLARHQYKKMAAPPRQVAQTGGVYTKSVPSDMTLEAVRLITAIFCMGDEHQSQMTLMLLRAIAEKGFTREMETLTGLLTDEEKG